MAFSITKIDPENVIVIDDDSGVYFDVIYTLMNRNNNTLDVRFNFTKDSANLAVLESFYDSRLDPSTGLVADSNYYDKTIVDGNGVVLQDTKFIDASGCYQLVVNPMRCHEKVRIRITPSDLTGDDTLIISINENALGA